MANSPLHPRADDGVQARLGFLSVAGATAGDDGVKLAKSQQSGSLHQYVKKVMGEDGEIVECPKAYTIIQPMYLLLAVLAETSLRHLN
jgi:hypothetical protein